jgi:hypothetical protein
MKLYLERAIKKFQTLKKFVCLKISIINSVLWAVRGIVLNIRKKSLCNFGSFLNFFVIYTFFVPAAAARFEPWTLIWWSYYIDMLAGFKIIH